jgi:nitrite reductase (NADH) large subunit
VRTLAQLKESTRASTGLRQLQRQLPADPEGGGPRFRRENQKLLCKCVPFTQENLREIIQSQRSRAYSRCSPFTAMAEGCEICKPALSYLVDVVWCGDHQEDRSARFINDRVHANIQNDGTFSVVPRIRGGVTSPAELRKIADVAEKYKAKMVKITGSQRIDLLGVQKADLPKILGRSWDAFRAGVHQGRAHGEDLRGHGVLPLRRAGRDLDGHRVGEAAGELVHAA